MGSNGHGTGGVILRIPLVRWLNGLRRVMSPFKKISRGTFNPRCMQSERKRTSFHKVEKIVLT